MIDFKDVQEKTPELEQFLLEIAKAAGATEAVMFNGELIKLIDPEV